VVVGSSSSSSSSNIVVFSGGSACRILKDLQGVVRYCDILVVMVIVNVDRSEYWCVVLVLVCILIAEVDVFFFQPPDLPGIATKCEPGACGFSSQRQAQEGACCLARFARFLHVLHTLHVFIACFLHVLHTLHVFMCASVCVCACIFSFVCI
jgi:hypothetical protein